MAGLIAGPPGQAQGASGAGGLARIELNNFYESTPVQVTAGALSASLPLDLPALANGTQVCATLGLDDNARQALARNGFVVVPYGPGVDMIEPYNLMTTSGVPSFITSDSLLHLYHVQFDEILKGVEEREFYRKLMLLTRALQADALGQYQAHVGELKEAGRRNLAFFTVALGVLEPGVPVPESVAAEVGTELANIDAHAGFSVSPIFKYSEDYSQYVPRGHYTRSEVLKRYFKGMMWYGRLTFLLKGSGSAGPAGDALVSAQDARIQTLQAALITLALDTQKAGDQALADIWNRIYGVTAFFVGLADDLTPYEYKEALHRVFGAVVNLEALADQDRLFELKRQLASLPNPQIYGGTGNCLVGPDTTPADLDKVLDKTKGMRLMGQRFIPDSYMFQRLVLPAVGRHSGPGTPFTLVMSQIGPIRGFPRGLDVMAVLGSGAALDILDREGDTDYAGYDLALNELIRLFRSFSRDEWTRNLYWTWLYALQPLLADFGEGYPAFMQTRAWREKELHAALGSWTELRHDTILYAKQSYTVGTTSIDPPRTPDRGYVEPVPEFFNRLSALTRMTRVGLGAMNVLEATQEGRLLLLEGILGRLTAIALTELEGGGPTAADYAYIETFGQALAPLQAGLSDAQAGQTALVADVHTAPEPGMVLEEAVGYVKLLVAGYRLPEGRTVLGAGPVFSYYEFKWPMGDRLTDEKWTNLLASAACPPAPEWVHSFTQPVNLNPEPSPAPAPRLAAPQAATGGFELHWTATPVKRYRVFYSDDLANWYLLQCPVIAEGALAGLLDPGAAATRQRFYRVRLVP